MAESQPSAQPWSTGRFGDYQWLETIDHDIDSFLRLCPEAILGRYLAITSFDSGPLCPTDEEKSSGWESTNDIAYSPRILTVDKLPYAGWDEWYVFESPIDLGNISTGNIFESARQPRSVSVLVNFRFSLKDSAMQPLAAIFWKQLEWISPHSYVADTDSWLIHVTRDENSFARVRKALIGPAKQIQ